MKKLSVSLVDENGVILSAYQKTAPEIGSTEVLSVVTSALDAFEGEDSLLGSKVTLSVQLVKDSE